MNLKTFTILFLLGILVSCSTTSQKEDDRKDQRPPFEFGTFNL